VAATGNDGHPDMTPMLDVVMQLLMYFIVCVRFTADEVSNEITLPPAQTATVGTKTEGDMVLLQITKEGFVRVHKGNGWDELDPKGAEYELNKWFTAAPKDPENNKKALTILVVRADKDTDWAKVYQFMQMAKKIGFTKFKMRAIMQQ
jgi:biopolymer transport protein ExbD